MQKKEALKILKAGRYSCIAWDEQLVYQAAGMGVKPLITPMRERRDFFRGLQVGDTIIGKAAALLLALSGAKFVYGCIMSRAAVTVLQQQGIAYEYARLVDFIYNRQQNGLCPLEQAVLEENDPERAWDRLEARIKELMAGQGDRGIL